ncbi:helix-turn-helix transcriptional regulator [Sphingobium estronivorans]|uniref:helix-turn-helix transcriptional regulator n=1 Tax=Sphingobium estronivorans TaxID=1577690 RepID=UPI0013C34069|nr:LuxR C-terminal-related transcriptional regulator [Sphingobium estronivorans]
MGIPLDPVESFSTLVLSLNASLVDEDPWRPFLLELSAQVDAKHGTLVLVPSDAGGRGTVITPTSTPQEIQEYIDRYLLIDPFVHLPEGQVVALYEYIGQAALENVPDYKQWFGGIDASHILGVDLRLASGFEARLRLSRAPGGTAFTQPERRWVEKILPHLRQALEIYQRLELSRSERAVMIDAVEQFAVGTVLLDSAFGVLKINEVAASILAEADGLALTDGRILLPDADADRQFRAVLAEVRGAPAGSRKLFAVERPSGRGDVMVIAQPVPTPGFMHAGAVPAVALLITDPARKRRIDGPTLCRQFALTPTEGAIAAALANGASVGEAAQELGIADNTVRAHLRSIFSKLGVNRQLQLVHLIHTSFPETLTAG